MDSSQKWQVAAVAMTAAWAAFATTVNYELEAWQMALVAAGALAMVAVAYWLRVRTSSEPS